MSADVGATRHLHPLLRASGGTMLTAVPIHSMPKFDIRRVATSDTSIAGILAVVVLLVGVATLHAYPLGVVHDDAVYAILAKALANGQGYRYLNLPGQPVATHFPPGYPAFLALLWRMAPDFPANVLLFKAANAVLLTLFFVMWGIVLRRWFHLSRFSAWMIAALAATSIPALLLSSLVLSETLFLLFVALSIYAGERALADRGTVGDAVLCGFLSGVSTLVRSPGIALVGACVLCLVARKSFSRAAIVAATSAALLLPWQLWSHVHGNSVPAALQGAYGPYGPWMSDALRIGGVPFLAQVLYRTSAQAIALVTSMVSVSGSAVAVFLAAICLCPALLLGLRDTWKRSRILLVFLAMYSCLVLIWPAPPIRYVWGIWPLVFTVLAMGVREVVLRLQNARKTIAWAGLLAATLVPLAGYAKYTVSGYRQRVWLGMPQQSGMLLYPLVNTVRNRVPLGGVVAISAEAAVYLYSGRATVPIYSFTATEFLAGPDTATQVRAMLEITQSYAVDLVLTSTPLQRHVIRELNRRSDTTFQLVDSAGGNDIFRRVVHPSPVDHGGRGYDDELRPR